jgi:hypothetical protein
VAIRAAVTLAESRAAAMGVAVWREGFLRPSGGFQSQRQARGGQRWRPPVVCRAVAQAALGRGGGSGYNRADAQRGAR